MCLENAKKYDYILVPVISPFKEGRALARNLLDHSFIEIYVNRSLTDCIKRDVKGHYKKALAGEIANFIGISPEVPYESPINPEIILNTEKETPTESVSKIISYLKINL